MWCTRISVAAWALLPALGVAQDEADELMLFEEIPMVVGASKYEQRVSDAPASVTIITSEQIARYGWRDLSELLETVRGVYISNDRNYDYLGVRGTSPPGDYNARVLVMLDGFRMNDPAYDAAPVGPDLPLEMGDIDRVEIIRGPGSALYGTSAMLAVVNIITRRGRDLQTVRVGAGAGSFGSYDGQVSWGHRYPSDWEVYLSGSGGASAGQDLYYREFDRELRNFGVAEDDDASWDVNVLAKVGRGDVTATAIVGSSHKEIPTGPWDVLFDADGSFTRDEYVTTGVVYDHTGPTGRSAYVSTRVGAYHYVGEYQYNWGTASDPLPRPNVDDVLSPYWDNEGRAGLPLGGSHLLVLGIDSRWAPLQSQTNIDVLPRRTIEYLDARSSSGWVAVFAQEEWDVAPAVVLSGGVRVGATIGLAPVITPRIAAILRPTKTTTIKPLFGTAFRDPNIYERFYEEVRTQKVPDDLGREQILSTELVVEQRVAEVGELVLSAFENRMTGLVEQQIDPADGLLVFDNVGRIVVHGVEAGGALRTPRVLGRASYALTLAEDSDGVELANAPTHLIQALVSPAIVPDKVFVGLQLVAEDGRRTLSGSRTDPFARLDLTVTTRELIPHVELQGKMGNVLDTTYGYPGRTEHRQQTIEQDGRSVWVRAAVVF